MIPRNSQEIIDVLLVNESIIFLKNRHRLIGTQKTEFLNSAEYKILGKYVVPKAREANLTEGKILIKKTNDYKKKGQIITSIKYKSNSNDLKSLNNNVDNINSNNNNSTNTTKNTTKNMENNKQKEELELVSHEIDLKLKKLSNATQVVNIKKRDDQFEEDEFEEEEKNINNRNPKIKEKEFKKEINNIKSDEEDNNQYFLDNRKDILYWYNINKLLDLTEAFEELNIIK